MEFSGYSKQLIENLLQIKAIQLNPQNPFTWASGWKSPVYCDNRKILSFPTVRNYVKTGLLEIAKADFTDYNCIAGVATAGIPWGAILADVLELPFVYVRNKPKGHGMKNTIEGVLPEHARVLVVEDVISTGMSSLQAVDDLREQGAQICGMVAIYTYEFPQAVSRFLEANVLLKTLTTYEVLVNVCLEKGFIGEDMLETLTLWRQNPGDWQK